MTLLYKKDPYYENKYTFKNLDIPTVVKEAKREKNLWVVEELPNSDLRISWVVMSILVKGDVSSQPSIFKPKWNH